MVRSRWKTPIRVLVTIAAWIVLITYTHKFGHLYFGNLKETFSAPIIQVFVQIIAISVLICLIWLSLPILPKITKRGIGMVVFWAVLLAIGHQLSHFGFHQFKDLLGEPSSNLNMGMLLLAGLLYLVVLSIPYVPGIEIGILIMVLFGPIGALIAYLATVGGIVLAFAAGRTLPASLTCRWLERIGLSTLASSPEATIRNLTVEGNSSRFNAARLGRVLLSNRHIALTVCLNLPGNSALGGGGGIGLLCGLGRTFNWKEFVATVIVAVSPVPILAAIGLLHLEPLLERHGLMHEVFKFLETFLVHE
jgi:hypothetical protein